MALTQQRKTDKPLHSKLEINKEKKNNSHPQYSKWYTILRLQFKVNLKEDLKKKALQKKNKLIFLLNILGQNFSNLSNFWQKSVC